MKYSSGGCKGAWQTANVRDGIKEGVDRGMAGQTKPVPPPHRLSQRRTVNTAESRCLFLQNDPLLAWITIVCHDPPSPACEVFCRPSSFVHVQPPFALIIHFSHVNLPSFPQTIPALDFETIISLSITYLVKSILFYIENIQSLEREREREVILIKIYRKVLGRNFNKITFTFA